MTAEDPASASLLLLDAADWIRRLVALRAPAPQPDWPKAEDFADPEDYDKALRAISEAYERREQARKWELIEASQEFLLLFPSHEHAEQIHAETYRHALYCLEAETPWSDKARNWIAAELRNPGLRAEHAVRLYEYRINHIARCSPSALDDLLPARPENSIPDAVCRLLAAFAARFPGSSAIAKLSRTAASHLMATPAVAIRILDEALLAATSEADRDRTQGVKFRLSAQGRRPPPIRFTGIDGTPVDLDAWKGKVVLINFWATWCGPCAHELRQVHGLHERWSAQGLRVLGISLDTDRDALTAFVAEHQIPWPQHFDGKGWESSIGISYGVSYIPTIYLIDRQGFVAEVDPREPDALIAKLVAGP